MAEDNSLDYSKSSDATFQMGQEASEEEETEEENTAENVYQNNPEDNKKLSEITMAEQIRKTFELEVKIPRILEGLHTNQFFFLDVTDDFYEKNYPTIIGTIADKKFGRFAGFKKGWFFVEKVEEQGGIDGWSTKITLNPIPPSLATYSKMQKEAQKTLIQAINQEIAFSGGGGVGNTNVSGGECTDNNEIAATSFTDEAFETASQNIIGNSGSNYAEKVKSMTCEEAIKSIKFTYSGYSGNSTCPPQMCENWPNVSGNCADMSRLVKCICDVKGVQCCIYHHPGHYWNLVKINNSWESVDLTTHRRGGTWGSSGYHRNSAGWNNGGK